MALLPTTEPWALTWKHRHPPRLVLSRAQELSAQGPASPAGWPVGNHFLLGAQPLLQVLAHIWRPLPSS